MFAGLIALGFDPCKLLAQVAIGSATLLGFAFPLLAAVVDFGKLTHRLHSLTSPMAIDHGGGGCWAEMDLIVEDRAIGAAAHLASERQRRLPPVNEPGEAMTYNRMEAKAIAGEHCRFCGDVRRPDRARL